MTTRQRRLIGRAHRRRSKGIPATSRAVAMAYAADQTPGLRESFQALVDSIRTSWGGIVDAFRRAARSTRADYVLVPPLPPLPAHRRPSGPLIHNGRKPR